MARKVDLSKLTTAELQAELARRNVSVHSRAGADWYFFPANEDDDLGDKYAHFWIVHKRYWHRHHAVRDVHIERMLTLPKGFAEAMESCFEFSRGDPLKGERLLESYGYQKIDRHKWQQTLFVHTCQIGGKKFRIDCECDTPALYATLKKHGAKGQSFPNLDTYRAWAESLAPNTKFEFYSSYDGGSSACFMPREVALALPPYPVDNIRFVEFE